MSNKLWKLGGWAFKHRFIVLFSWIAIVALAVTAMTVFQKPIEDSFTIPGTESQIAFDKLEESMPAATSGSGRIVFAAPEGEALEKYEAVIDDTLAEVAELTDVNGTVSPFESEAISDDARIGLAQVSLEGSAYDVDPALTEGVMAALETAREAGLQAEAGGDIISGAPEVHLFGPGEIVGVIIAAITLLVTFGSLVAAGMPLVTAFVGIGVGISSIFALSSVVDINTVTPTLAIMLGLAVGIDYSLFIVTRYRKYRMDGLAAKEAVARAIATAGNAVVFAALTVIIALSGLTVVGIPFLSVMGLAAAGTVAVAALVAISLIPALLGFGGDKVLSKKQRATLAAGKTSKDSDTSSVARRYVTGITKRPFLVIAIVIVTLGALALPVTKLHLGFPTAGSAPSDSTERKAYDLITEGFGPGYNGPLLLVADLNDDLPKAQAELQSQILLGALNQVPQIAYAQPAGSSETGNAYIYQVIPTTGPSDLATTELVKELRKQGSEFLAGNGNLYVTGQTAITLDMDTLLTQALPKYLLVVVGLSFVLLVIVFRSLIVPLKATLGFLLTIAAVLGVLVMLFQWGWFGLFEITPIVSFLPIITVGILFGLAMDYEFFLVSGMHEAYEHEDKDDAKAAVINGYSHNASVVTAAAIIMIAVFAGFIFTDQQMIQMIGVALAVGILIDAFIVRMTFVPAVMALFGKTAWWIPGWLGKLIPKVSIDGDETTVTESLKPKHTKK